MKSALLPGAIEPVTSPMPASCALRRVAVWRAKLYVALRGLQQLSLYFKNRTCKGVVCDGFGIAAVEVEIFVAA